MKKTLITLGLILTTYMIIGVKAEKIVEIPDEAIRIRVIGNSNSEYDQEKKQELRKDVQLYMQSLLKDAKTISKAREIINNNLENIKINVDNYLHNLNYDTSYDINFGLNYNTRRRKRKQLVVCTIPSYMFTRGRRNKNE